MLVHLSQFSVVTSLQHGFFLRHSALTNFVVAEELATKWLDEDSAVNLIHLDSSKALGSFNRQLLQEERKGYGIAPTVINRAESLLSRLTFQVNVNGDLSQTSDAIKWRPPPSALSYVRYYLSSTSTTCPQTASSMQVMSNS